MFTSPSGGICRFCESLFSLLGFFLLLNHRGISIEEVIYMKKSNRILFLQTLSQVVGFMIWVVLAGLMPFIKEDIHLEPSQIALLTAVPVVLGSLLRIPFSYLTNRFGSRKVFGWGFILLVLPVYYISISHSFLNY